MFTTSSQYGPMQFDIINVLKLDSLEGMSIVTAGPDIIPHIDNELDLIGTDTPSFISHFRATMNPPQCLLLYTNTFNLYVLT